MTSRMISGTTELFQNRNAQLRSTLPSQLARHIDHRDEQHGSEDEALHRPELIHQAYHMACTHTERQTRTDKPSLPHGIHARGETNKA